MKERDEDKIGERKIYVKSEMGVLIDKSEERMKCERGK